MNWSAAIKRIGQTVTAVYSVFFEPVPVPDPLTVWPRVVIGLAVILSLPLLFLVRSIRWRGRITCVAVLLVVIGFMMGFQYWLALPGRTLQVRNGLYVIGDETEETLRKLKEHDVDLIPYIDGNPTRPVRSFFEADSISENATYLGARYVMFLACVSVGLMILLEWMPG